MTALHRHPCRLLLVAMALGIVVTGRPSRAQDEDVPEEGAPVAPQAPGISEENFDQWVFGGRDAGAIRGKLDTLLTLQVEDVDRICGTSEAQETKLRLAGQGDIKRFFDRVEDKRRMFQLLKHDQNRMNEIFQEIQPLQMALNSQPYGDGSIFSKTLKKALDEGQAARYDKVHRERILFRYRAKVDLMVTMLDNSLGLDGEQRRRFGALLMEETRPPKKFGQYDYYVVMVQAAKIPEDKVKPIFDDSQWRLLRRQMDQMRGIEQFLKQGDFLPEAAAASPKKPADFVIEFAIEPASGVEPAEEQEKPEIKKND